MELRRYNIGDLNKLVGLVSKYDAYDDVSENSGQSPRDYMAIALKSRGMYLLGRNPSKEMFMYVPINSVTYHVHVVIDKDWRGIKAVVGGLSSEKWMFNKTGCMSILAFAKDRQGCRMAAMAGMTRVGKTMGTFFKNGKLIPETIYNKVKPCHG